MQSSNYTDLSDRFGPMTAKELRQSLRRSSFVFPFLGIHLFATAAIIAEFQFDLGGSGDLSAMLFWDPDHIGPFWWVAMIICGILMPLGGFLLLPQEIDEGNHEILLLTKLSRWQIVFGKFMMLWGLSVLTFTSLLPYIIIRYFIGGIEWFHELANAGTVLSAAAVISAAALAASGFTHLAAKMGVFFLFLFSAITGGGLSLIGGGIWMNAAATSKWAIPSVIFYHLCAITAVVCYAFLGMIVARSRLRLATMNFELKPSAIILIIVGLAPFVIGMVAAVTCGFGSIAGVLLLTFLAWRSDITPKAPKTLPPPPPNTPPPIPTP
ncbi:MAG: hypothetical protein AB8D78_07155 [Akkermansiaceae bacterium]